MNNRQGKKKMSLELLNNGQSKKDVKMMRKLCRKAGGHLVHLDKSTSGTFSIFDIDTSPASR